jgi:transglutaminase-like putative cysteine protease
MVRADASAAVSVERFFQFSLLGLVTCGYLAVAGSGYLDTATIVLTATGLALRALLICEIVQLEITDRATTLATLSYTGFYLLDYFVLSRDFLQATIHLVFFLAILKILTAKSTRDHLYTAVIAFLELLAAAILSINFSFFVFLAFYLLFAIAALTSGEIRRSMFRAQITARAGPKRFHPRLAALSGMITIGILGLTAGMFFILPRTAGAAFSRLISHRFRLVGFSNQVTLGEMGEIKTISRPVMHIRVWGDFPRGLKWRGGTLIDFDGKRWSNASAPRENIPVSRGEARLVPNGEWPPGPGVNYDVDFEELETDALFFAGTPVSVTLRSPRLIRREGGTYQLGHSPGQSFHYSAYSILETSPETAPPLASPPVLPLASRERYLQLPPLDSRIAVLARATVADAPTDLVRARAIERRLRTEYGYTLESPNREAPDPLAYFLFNRKKGHCEYFASAMTVMLRSIGIPARIASGFQSGVYNSMTELWLVRASDAHTWVEAWIPGHGWTTFDPTPPDPNPPQFALMTKLALYLDAAETFWRQWVVGYDASQQGSLADQMEQGARRMGTRWFDTLALLQEGWSTRIDLIWKLSIRWGLLVLLAVFLALFAPRWAKLLRMRRRVRAVRRGQASVGDATLLYERMLAIVKRHGYQKPAWFTPAEFAASLPGGALASTVAEFTAAYNALRFGGRTEVAPRLSNLLDKLSGN